MAPYFQDEYITLYCGDGIAGLRDLAFRHLAGAVVLTDPKYNIGFDFGPEVDDAMADEEYEAWSRAWFSAVRDQAASVAFTPGVSNLPMWYRLAPPDWQMAWLKPNARRPNLWEPVLSYGYRRHDDVVVAPIDFEDNRILWHPCPKPYGWGEGLLLRTVQSPDQYVIDPFTGSGTVPTTSARMGLRCVAFELQERYCERLALFWRGDEEQEVRGRAREQGWGAPWGGAAV